jgi:hypothetical protein
MITVTVAALDVLSLDTRASFTAGEKTIAAHDVIMNTAHGFARHGGPIGQMTTRPSLITRWPERAMKLDWFLSRGLAITESWITPSLGAGDTPLSDHDMITCRIDGFA